ncbi:MAG: response regulator receiver protein [Candidatus Magnetoglobus multicellularis str. Araruama]|uniref:Response regulator receiver protein n=1 Tax=Candidatus Magnetoglobus multicellularis str. Araruama TaxID=890399 RepID=A0A1V1P8B3_9BACT|nr:MAG: response regulator receiver protein [Candidatus Magnetoglobus multicellularis str. Araruama]
MPTIVIADDDNHLRSMLKQIIETEDYNVIEAMNGQQAIDFVKKHPVDLVITDLIMPTKEGIETINELKHLNPDLPIFAMSGGSLTNAKVNLKIALNLGVSKTFLKPFDVNEMLEAIKAIV